MHTDYYSHVGDIVNVLPETAVIDPGLNASVIEAGLRIVGLDGISVDFVPGVRVSTAFLTLPRGIRLKQVRERLDDLALRLAVPMGIRIRKDSRPGTVALEIPHQSASDVKVGLGDVLARAEDFDVELPWLVGLSADGAGVITDIAAAPHVLIGGQTGSGKSSHLHALMASLAIFTDPDEVEIILVDPKRVDLVRFRDLPHVRKEPIVTVDGFSALLTHLEHEVKFRFEELAHANVPDLKAYNQWAFDTAGEEQMERIIVVIDELATVLAGPKGKLNGERLTALAQVCRAAGVHIVAATQRPSATSLPTQLRSQLTSRVACRVASSMDSRLILDTTGAESLLGHGDSLVQWGCGPVRVQGTYVSDAWLSWITDTIVAAAQEGSV